MSSSPVPPLRSPDLLARQQSQLLIVDMQDRLIPSIADSARVVAKCRLLVRAAQLLAIPITTAEQYPAGLGPTVPELAELLTDRQPKTCFSAAGLFNPGTTAELIDDRSQVLVAGIETHVCVLQTALDLAANGYQVFVAADATGSRSEIDRQLALQRLANSGVILLTAESALFEWCETSTAPEFKQISQLVKEG
jgi:nicotinamidase-related amidase